MLVADWVSLEFSIIHLKMDKTNLTKQATQMVKILRKHAQFRIFVDQRVSAQLSRGITFSYPVILRL